MEFKHDLALFVISKDLGQRRGNLETQYSSQETQTHKGERKVFTCAADRTRWPSGAVGILAASSTSAAAPLPPGETAEPRFAAAVSLPFLAAALYLATAIAVVQDENTILLWVWASPGALWKSCLVLAKTHHASSLGLTQPQMSRGSQSLLGLRHPHHHQDHMQLNLKRDCLDMRHLPSPTLKCLSWDLIHN